MEEEVKDFSEDYYALLNVPKNASKAEIRSAYKQLSKLYHPDKHTDEAMQQLARKMFPRIQKAYTVLSDEQSRAVYDAYGVKGVSAGNEIAPYYNTAAELKAEFEMAERQREHERFLNMAAPKGMMAVTIDATKWFTYAHAHTHEEDGDDMNFLLTDEDIDDVDDELTGLEFEEEEGMEHFEDEDEEFELYEDDETPTITEMVGGISIKSMKIEQEMQTRIDDKNTLKFFGSITNSKRSRGGIGVSWDRFLSPSLTLQTTLSFGTQNLIKAKLQRTFHKIKTTVFGELLFASMAVKSAHVLVAGLTTGFVHRLTDALSLVMHLKIGVDSSLTTSLIHNTKTFVNNISAKLSKEVSSLSVESRFDISESTKVILSASYSPLDTSVGYTLERTVSEHARFAMSVSVGLNSGVMTKVKYVSARQAYVIPVHLSDHFALSAVATASVLPIALFFAVRNLLVLPYLNAQEREKTAQRRKMKRMLMRKRREEARSAVLLMTQSVMRKIAAEEKVDGLVIEQALYGKILSSTAAQPHTVDDSEDDEQSVIDVTVPLQCLVRDSKLILQDISKSHLVGFYDPCPEETKHLRIVYRFRGSVHEALFDDEQAVSIPRKAHRRQQQ
eukprot:m.90849 g.90849  ORF g.90849 m.90849 type:complete len:615 (+) comp12318_c0_seq1:15-1859(+)